MVPAVNFSNKLMSMIMILGLIGAGVLKMFPFTTIILVFVILQAVITLFTLVTLPVEFDASRRALIWLKSSNISNEQELTYSEDALKWAASTYVVAALAAAANLLYYLAILRD